MSLMAYENDLHQYMSLSKMIKDLTKQREEIANGIKEFMGEASKGEARKFKVSWPSSVRETFDKKKFKEDNPEYDLSGYCQQTVTRTFKVTER